MEKKLQNYILFKIIYENERVYIYEAISQKDQSTIALKTFKNEHPSLTEIAQFQHEYEILKNLSIPGVVKVIDIKQHGNACFLLLEDFKGVCLRDYLEINPVDILNYHTIAISLAQTVADIHEKGIIHKDINPENIILNEQNFQTLLMEFGYATQLTKENPQVVPSNLLVGSLYYISPEQTGRLNRELDYRTDIYSLGVVLYEILTQQPPFQSRDAMELIHAHIAKTPLSPSVINPLIPKPVSDVIMKCLAKMPEDRYQSASGLKNDLEECLKQLKETKTVANFIPGQRDIFYTFEIPNRLYGRENEYAEILSAYDRITFGRCEWLHISGAAGSGKTVLVTNTQASIQKQRACFIRGKYDQMQTDLPYSGLIEACRDLIRQVLASNEEELEIVKENLQLTLGENCQVMIEIIPELELLMGKQPPTSIVEPQASQNRLKLIFRRFIQNFAVQKRPLVIFLDDFQWADQASINLLESLMTDRWLNYLLLITTSRELVSSDPIQIALSEIKKQGANFHSIHLGMLDIENITMLVKDTLHCTPQEASPLAFQLLHKTAGNPYFVTQFLKNLYEEKLIFYDKANQKWAWNNIEIERKSISENLIELMLKKIRKLKQNTQKLLTYASVIGSQFDLRALADLDDLTLNEALMQIWEAVNEELLQSLDDNYLLVRSSDFEKQNQEKIQDIPILFRFAHERIQVAAYSLLGESEKSELHGKHAEYLIRKTPSDKIEESIFNIVYHLNKCIKDLSPEKALQVIHLNLIACRKAKREAAYKTAFECINIARGLLKENSWETHYDLTYNVYLESAGCAYLTRSFDLIDGFSDVILRNAKTNIERGKLYILKINYYTSIAETQNALECGTEGLIFFGIKLSRDPTIFKIFKELAIIKWKLRKHKIPNLQQLPPMQDPEKIFLIEYLISLLPPAFVSNKKLYCIITLMMMRMSLNFGNSPLSFFVYMSYAGLLQIMFRDYKTAAELGQLAITLCRKSKSPSYMCKANYVMAAIINHWTHSLEAGRQYMDVCFKTGLESGEFIFYSFISVYYGFLDGVYYRNVVEARKRMEANKETIFATKNQQSINAYRIKYQLSLLLTKKDFDGITISDQNFNDDEFFALIDHNREEEAAYQSYAAYKIGILYLFYHYEEAYRIYQITDYSRDAAKTLISERELNFFYSLTLIALLPTRKWFDRLKFWYYIRRNQSLLKYWTSCCQANNLHRYLLVEAEIARASKQIDKALELYDQSIRQARDQEYVNEEALANELAAKCCLAEGKPVIAKAYLLEAHYAYYRWGAISKVRQLETLYPEIFTEHHEITFDEQTNSHHLSTADPFHQKVALAAGKTSFDIDAVMQAATLLSGEIHQEKLLSKQLKIVLEYAGADRAVILRELNGKWVLQGEKRLDSPEAKVLPNLPLEDQTANVCVPVIQYVIRTRQNIVLNDVQHQGLFTQDLYILAYQPKSVLCMILSHQGKPTVILYLENHLATETFTPDRLRILWLLSSQIATSTENAALYSNLEVATDNLRNLNRKLESYSHDLENKVGDRTRELQQKNIQLSETLQTLKEMQKQIVQQEKLAAFGALTQGVAHEIKNPLNFINNFSSLSMDLLQDLSNIVEKLKGKDDKEAQSLIQDLNINMQKICEHSKRADKIVMSMLQHSKATKGSKELVNLNLLFSEYLYISKNQAKQKYPDLHVEIVTCFDPNLKNVYVVPQDIGRVLLNLLDNALFDLREKVKKVGEDFSPKIEITTQQDHNTAKIIIRDNGMGIKKEHHEKIFQPFFTTKPTGTGVGLGLSIAYDIISKEHEGSITFKSIENEFTEFVIELQTQD